MRNEQPPEKAASGDGSVLAVNSLFYTLQGEGPFAGMPAVFIRLAGCNLQCPLCDTEYTNRDNYSVEEILDTVDGAWRNVVDPGHGAMPIVVITGGEPFRQPIRPLVETLLAARYVVQIETNGTLYRSLPWGHKNLHVVCSPKAGKVNADLLPWIGTFKYVATVDSLQADGLPSHALEHPNAHGLFRPPPGHTAKIYLQPVDEQNIARNARNTAAVVESCMAHGYRLCLQLHKIVGLA